MTRRTTSFLLVGLVCSLTAVSACNKNNSTTNPSPIQTTETFSGTINPGGFSSHAFNVSYQYAYTDASVTVTSLTTVATGASPSITVGVGFGNYSVGVCTRVPSVSNPAAPVNQELPTTGQQFGPGTYCVQVYDNPDAPTVTEPMRYNISVKHY